MNAGKQHPFLAQSGHSYSSPFLSISPPPLSGMNAFITLFRKAMGSTAAHYFAERKNSGR